MDTTIPTSEVLHRAADLIEERGWTKGSEGWGMSGRSGIGLCLEGAISAAAGTSVEHGQRQTLWHCLAYRSVAEYLGLAPGGAWGNNCRLWRWNDRRSTAAEVIEVLRACALIEAAREREAEVSVERERMTA